MKNILHISVLILSIFLINACTIDLNDDLSQLERDIIGEWVVDDFVISSDNLIEDNELIEMHFLFEEDFDFELSWFEGNDFFVVDGEWTVFEDDFVIDIEVNERLYFFCDQKDLNFNLFFFAGDLQFETICENEDWIEIQLEKI